MKSKKQFIKSALIRDAAALFFITMVSGFGLSYVYEITKEPIAAQAEQKTLKANREVFKGASSFEEDEDLTRLAQAQDTDLAGLNADYAGVTINSISKAVNGSNEVVGYIINLSTSAGYKDGINFILGYSANGTITGIEFLAINETAGLGMKAKEPEFTNQFFNKNVKRFAVTKTGAAAEEEIDAISSATITSRAVTNAVNAGIGFVAEYAAKLGGKIQ